MLTSAFPRVALAHLPTPLEFLPRLSRHLGGPRIYVKRDDCTGLGTGGNKTRKLEFLLAHAQQRGATCIVTSGGVQSNHARLTAAAASRLGLKCELVLDIPVAKPSPAYVQSGNLLLDALYGAKIHLVRDGEDMNTRIHSLVNGLQHAGETPYVIPLGGSNATGAMGYVACAEEMLAQTRDQAFRPDHIVLASGSGGTHAGLVVGLQASALPIPVLGIGVSAPTAEQRKKVLAVATPTAELLGITPPDEKDIVVNCSYVGAGYGATTSQMKTALRLLARLEGLVLDPVYTGKAMAGLIDLIAQRTFDRSDVVVFVHTGGTSGLFGYTEEFGPDLA